MFYSVAMGEISVRETKRRPSQLPRTDVFIPTCQIAPTFFYFSSLRECPFVSLIPSRSIMIQYSYLIASNQLQSRNIRVIRQYNIIFLKLNYASYGSTLLGDLHCQQYDRQTSIENGGDSRRVKAIRPLGYDTGRPIIP